MTPGSPPGKPGQLTFHDFHLPASSIQLTWTEPNNGEISAYYVEYYQPDKKAETITTVTLGPNQRTFLVENLIENTPYIFAVRAENQWGLGKARMSRGGIREREVTVEQTDGPTTIVQVADDVLGASSSATTDVAKDTATTTTDDTDATATETDDPLITLTLPPKPKKRKTK